MSIKLDGYGLKSSDVAAIESIVKAVLADVGGGGGSGTVTSVGASLPIVVTGPSTDPVVNIPGLAAFGAVGQAMRVAAGGSALEWYTPAAGGTVTAVTGTVPLASSGGATPAISMVGLSAWGTAGQVPTINGSANGFIWGTPSGGGGGSLLPAANFNGAGPYLMTHADHANRGCVYTGTAALVIFNFQNLAGDANLLDQDLFTIHNSGPGVLLAGTNTVANRGCKMFAMPGETLEFMYQAVDNNNITQTIDSRRYFYGEGPAGYVTCLPQSATLTQTGISMGVVDSSIAQAVTIDGTNLLSHLPKVRYQAQASGANRGTGIRALSTASQFVVPTAGIPYGWKARFRGGVVDAITDGRQWMGFGNPGNGEANLAQNAFALGANSTHSQLLLMYNDASGNCQTAALDGTNFPVAAGNFIEFYVEAWADATKAYWYWEARNLLNGVIVRGILDGATADMPVPGTTLHYEVSRNSGPTTASTGQGVVGGVFAGPFA